jgi:tetratricopeptide (TPR) repeat protein
MAIVLGVYGLARGMAGQLEEAISSMQDAQRLAEQADDPALRLVFSPAFWLAVAGRNRQALARFDRAIEAAGDDFQLGRQIYGQSLVIFSIFYRGLVLAELGRLGEARPTVDRALRLAREHDDIECQDWAHGMFGFLSWVTGEPGDGLAHARESLEIAERLGSSFSRTAARTHLAYAHLAREEHAEALAVAEEGLAIMRDTRTALLYEAALLQLLSEARLGLNDREGARAAAAEGAASAARQGARIQEAGCRLRLGRALLPERPSDARAELERALELAGEDGPVYIPHVLVGFAELARLDGNEHDRLRHLEEAHRLFEEQGATGHARRVAADIATAAA